MARFAFAAGRPPTLGIFLVAKKSGAQKIMFDTRWANQGFPPPPRTQLPTAAAFSKLEGAECDVRYFNAGDIQNAFYAIGIPDDLGDSFRLGTARADSAGCPTANGRPAQPGDLLCSHL